MMADVSVQALTSTLCLDQAAVGFIDEPDGRLALILEDGGQRKLGALAGAWRREMHRRRLAERDGGIRLYERIAGLIGARRWVGLRRDFAQLRRHRRDPASAHSVTVAAALRSPSMRLSGIDTTASSSSRRATRAISWPALTTCPTSTGSAVITPASVAREIRIGELVLRQCKRPHGPLDASARFIRGRLLLLVAGVADPVFLVERA